MNSWIEDERETPDKDNKLICTTCDGDGQYEFMDMGYPRTVQCETCDGDGRVSIPDPEEGHK